MAVTRNGQIFLSPGNKQVNADDLPDKVRDLLTNRTDKTVYIKADKRAKYEGVEDVIDNLRAAGVNDLGLLTEGRNCQVRPSDGLVRRAAALACGSSG